MDINSSVSQIAAGFQDCCVRVWSLNKDDTHTSSVDVSYTFSEVLPMSKHSLDKKKSSNMTSQASSSSMMVAGIAATDYGNGNRDNRMDTKDDDESNTSLIEFRGHSMPVYCVHQHGVINSSSNIQSHDSRWILSGSADKTIRLWDMTIGHCVSKYFSTSAVWSVQFNPLGYYFASGNHDKSVTVYSMDRNEPLRYLREHLNDVNAVQWHPNSALLLSGSDDRTIRLWDIRTANCARILKGATSPVTALAVSPTGETAVGGCEDGKIYTWDLASGKALTVMMGHKRNEPVYSINYSNDSKSIISGGADCSVRIWDALQARAKRGLHAHDRHSNSTDNKAVTAMDRVIKHTDSQLVLYPKHTFYTKSCPVYYANYNLQNLAFAGGAFSLSYATGT